MKPDRHNPNHNQNAPAGNISAKITPEFFPIPQRGHDPFFGLGRSSFYDFERRGLLRLVRVRKPGNVRGKVLVPFTETAALIRRLAGKGGQRAHPRAQPSSP